VSETVISLFVPTAVICNRGSLDTDGGGSSQISEGFMSLVVAYPGGGGEFQQIQLRTQDRENGVLGAVYINVMQGFARSHSTWVGGGTAVAQWLRCCATNRKVAGSIPAGVIGFFSDIKSFRSHCGPGVDSASNRNEYEEHFLGVKAAGA